MKKIFFLLTCLITVHSVYSQSEDTIITKLFSDSYHVIKLIRQPNGVYIDALSYHVSDKPGAIVANGVGLVSLCIADSMFKKTGDTINWEPHAADKVNATLLQFMNFKNLGRINSKGLFRRYFDVNTGLESPGWGTEYSTIDNAIFAMGIVMCRNYFSTNTDIVKNANKLLNSMDFTASISDNGQQLYMILDANGNRSAPVGAFNEYMIVSWLAKNVSALNPGNLKSQIYWSKYYSNPDTTSVSHPNYWGYELISDGGFISDFIPQFNYYYCHYFKNSESYTNYFDNARRADSLWWTKAIPGINSYEWGLGAGENPGGGSYSANAIDNNSSHIISPHIIAGFIPVYKQSKSDLIKLYNNGKGASVYELPDDTSRKVLWRYSHDDTTLRCPYIQAVDFSTMLYGLASLPEYLGNNFFDKINDIKIPFQYNTNIQHTRAETFSIFPNPVKNIFYLETEGISKESTFILYNSKGQEILKQKLTDKLIPVNISNFESGVYLVKLLNNKSIEARKFIKE